MDITERELLKKVLILEEKIDAWYPWHCSNNRCKHHMCKVRTETLFKLENKLRVEEVNLDLLRYRKRTLTSLGV
jgi:hypothetical protein